ncbi:MAG: 3-deoxy-manno-octulosonate cytidylyltransferase [Acidiferrobacteraceae bacterium]
MKIIIPARYGSSRLPGKALADIAGKTLLERVYECAKRSEVGEVIIATDDERIRQTAEGFMAQVCMTSPQHASGTERIAEVVEQLRLPDQEIVLNLQGDEPLMPPQLLDLVAKTLRKDAGAAMATAACAIESYESFIDPNIVKVVCDARGRAMYFSRAPVPWPMNRRPPDQQPAPEGFGLRHIGLYAYRVGFIRCYAQWNPSPLEEIEILEQLRILWHGEAIAVCKTDFPPLPGVDTPADLERVRRYFESKPRV